RNGAFDLEPLPAQRAALEAYAGSRVVLGIRPEDLYVADSRRLPERTAGLDAVVSQIEPMGNESFVYASISEQALIARVSPQALPGKGESIGLAVDLERLHFFDAGTERAIVNHDVRRSGKR
ncbi:MAG: TOBE domain-containing protein, partial [Proteobacteria bacterium]|nr:TOBE domain-containing protein [Pseudomonadota bacterium]